MFSPSIQIGDPSRFPYSPIDLWEAIQKHEFVFHVTNPSNVERIRDEGLRTMMSNGNRQDFPHGRVCLFIDAVGLDGQSFCEIFCGWAMTQRGGVAVYRVRTSDLCDLGVAIDTTFDVCLQLLNKGKSATAILNKCGAFACCSDIPPGHLELI